jgi:phosphoenolpyruvate---glycerone phosphotransferase subunit DhaL
VRHRAHLDRLDASLGDGDHGENMSVGFGDAVRAIGPDVESRDVGEVLRNLGQLLVASVGGAGGSLYGTAFMEAGIAVAGRTGLDAAALAMAFDAAAEGLARRGRCRIGDKTIYDALRPAADAVGEASRGGEDIATALGRAAAAANVGMRMTRPLIARRGLALRLGERSRGHQDPGATSCFLLVRAMLPDRRQ